MKAALAGFVTVVAALLSGCSETEIQVDYDPRADFSSLHTWTWTPAPAPEKPTAPIDPLTLQRARSAVESVLTARGFAQAPQDRADFLVQVDVFIERHLGVEPGFYGGWGWGYGTWPGYGWGPYWGGGWYSSQVYAVDHCVLAISILQARPSTRVLWRGVAESRRGRDLTPSEREELIHQKVEEILSSFPPGRHQHPPS